MSILITGATGSLGQLVIAELLGRGVPAGQITAGGRNEVALAEFASRGLKTARLDYRDPESLRAAFAGQERVLLISSNDMNDRAGQHANAVAAAAEAGVGHLAYTSILDAQNSSHVLAPDHAATERVIEASGVPFTFLRDGWYNENYLPMLEQARQTGEISSATAGGRIASAARADYAAAAATVLTGEGHAGRTYELAGDTAWNFAELADILGEVLGTPVSNIERTPAEQGEALRAAGLDAGTAGFLVAMDEGVAAGTLDNTSGELRELIGRPTRTLIDTLRDA